MNLPKLNDATTAVLISQFSCCAKREMKRQKRNILLEWNSVGTCAAEG